MMVYELCEVLSKHIVWVKLILAEDFSEPNTLSVVGYFIG